ncbi:MAG: dCTP deaminase, partial [Paraglaciecola sp.]|nr:dCTP deaminase [Paraglaciecola sp.]
DKPYNARVDAKYKGQSGATASRISADDKSAD